MRNQYMDIPPHLKPALHNSAEEIRNASEQLVKAHDRFRDAFLARIAFANTTNGVVDEMSPEFTALIKEIDNAKDELNMAGKRYNAAIRPRIELTATINTAIMHGQWH